MKEFQIKTRHRSIKRLYSFKEKLNGFSRRYSWIRLSIFGFGLFISLLFGYYGKNNLGWISLLFFTLVFTIVAFFHRRILFSLKRLEKWIVIKEIQLARLELDWQKIDVPDVEMNTSHHPFARDIDVIGPRSLHHLIDSAVSDKGSQKLADWLCSQQPDLKTINSRQKLVKELAGMPRFRNRLLLEFVIVSKEQLQNENIMSWIKAVPSRSIFIYLSIAVALLVLSAAFFVSNMVFAWKPYWVLFYTAYALFTLSRQTSLAKYFKSIIVIDDELAKLLTIFKYLSRYPFHNSKYIKEFCREFQNDKNPISVLRKIKWLTVTIGMRMNPVMMVVLNAVFPWDFYFSSLVYMYQKKVGKIIPVWLEKFYELEALSSLANFAALNPEYTFPRCQEYGKDFKEFHVEKLGHPLIHPTHKVCNNFKLAQNEIAVITGSNMAGKSTFLKTVGVNLCLAYAGAPVNAALFQVPLFRLYTCIQINDSVTDGLSFFYTEVKRLKLILDVVGEQGEMPVLFLIDEIFKGTNNKERLIGSRSYLEEIVRKKGIGLVSTHDLELARLSDDYPNLKNYHFRETIENNKMVFDFLLRPGPCPTTNALRIMQLEGLPVLDQPTFR